MSAEILDVGHNKIWLDPENLDQIKEAMTKEDVRALIQERLIKKKTPAEQSKARAKVLHKKKKKGRKSGQASKRGTKKARTNQKTKWIKNVRAQRKKLKELKQKGEIKGKYTYAKLYRMIKGGYFKGKRYVEALAKGESK